MIGDPKILLIAGAVVLVLGIVIGIFVANIFD